jgi:hypothetical protein
MGRAHLERADQSARTWPNALERARHCKPEEWRPALQVPYTAHGPNGLDSSATVFTVAAAGSSAACRITIIDFHLARGPLARPEPGFLARPRHNTVAVEPRLAHPDPRAVPGPSPRHGVLARLGP